jgi:hypothetical protein
LLEDKVNFQCQTVTCDAGKVLKGDGTCVDACPDYELKDKDSKCTISTCKAEEKKSITGVCAAACPEFYEDASKDGLCTLFADHACGEAAPFQTGNKECVASCPEYLFKEDSKKRCQTTVCADAQLLKPDGTCVAACPDYSAADKDNKKCVTATCEGATKLLGKDGVCAKACPAYEVASADGKKCQAAPSCAKKLTVLGACVDACPAFFKDDAATSNPVKCIKIENVCKADKNSDGKVFMQKDGATCVKVCPDYNEPKDNECHEVTCASGEKRTLLGKCLAACPQLTTAEANGDCKALANACTGDKPFQDATAAGGCAAACPVDGYVRANTAADGKKSCIQDVCPADQVLKKADGTCEACAAYSKRSDSKTCKADVCKAREKLLSDGSCGPCPDYQVTKGEVGTSQACEQPACKDSAGAAQGNYVVGKDGVCVACADYFLADATARACKPGNLENLGAGKLAAQFILQKDGTAKECEYAKPDATKTASVNGASVLTECKATVCDAGAAEAAILREKVLLNGDCETCPAKQKRDPEDPKACVVQVCETKGWGPNLLAVCVDLAKTRVDPLPEGVTDANITDAQAKLDTMLKEVAKSVEALQGTMTSLVKLAFGLA